MHRHNVQGSLGIEMVGNPKHPKRKYFSSLKGNVQGGKVFNLT